MVELLFSEGIKEHDGDKLKLSNAGKRNWIEMIKVRKNHECSEKDEK